MTNDKKPKKYEYFSLEQEKQSGPIQFETRRKMSQTLKENLTNTGTSAVGGFGDLHQRLDWYSGTTRQKKKTVVDKSISESKANKRASDAIDDVIYSIRDALAKRFSDTEIVTGRHDDDDFTDNGSVSYTAMLMSGVTCDNPDVVAAASVTIADDADDDKRYSLIIRARCGQEKFRVRGDTFNYSGAADKAIHWILDNAKYIEPKAEEEKADEKAETKEEANAQPAELDRLEMKKEDDFNSRNDFTDKTELKTKGDSVIALYRISDYYLRKGRYYTQAADISKSLVRKFSGFDDKRLSALDKALTGKICDKMKDAISLAADSVAKYAESTDVVAAVRSVGSVMLKQGTTEDEAAKKIADMIASDKDGASELQRYLESDEDMIVESHTRHNLRTQPITAEEREKQKQDRFSFAEAKAKESSFPCYSEMILNLARFLHNSTNIEKTYRESMYCTWICTYFKVTAMCAASTLSADDLSKLSKKDRADYDYPIIKVTLNSKLREAGENDLMLDEVFDMSDLRDAESQIKKLIETGDSIEKTETYNDKVKRLQAEYLASGKTDISMNAYVSNHINDAEVSEHVDEGNYDYSYEAEKDSYLAVIEELEDFVKDMQKKYKLQAVVEDKEIWEGSTDRNAQLAEEQEPKHKVEKRSDPVTEKRDGDIGTQIDSYLNDIYRNLGKLYKKLTASERNDLRTKFAKGSMSYKEKKSLFNRIQYTLGNDDMFSMRLRSLDSTVIKTDIVYRICLNLKEQEPAEKADVLAYAVDDTYIKLLQKAVRLFAKSDDPCRVVIQLDTQKISDEDVGSTYVSLMTESGGALRLDNRLQSQLDDYLHGTQKTSKKGQIEDPSASLELVSPQNSLYNCDIDDLKNVIGVTSLNSTHKTVSFIMNCDGAGMRHAKQNIERLFEMSSIVKKNIAKNYADFCRFCKYKIEQRLFFIDKEKTDEAKEADNTQEPRTSVSAPADLTDKRKAELDKVIEDYYNGAEILPSEFNDKELDYLYSKI